MPPTGAVRRPKRRKTTRGPQGLPIQATSPARPSPPPTGLVHNVTQTVTSQPKVQRAARRNLRRTRANLRVSGDPPVPGGRTRGIDARKSPEYRAVLLHLIGEERKRLGIGGSLYKTKYIRPSVTNAALEGELALLRASAKHGGSYQYSYRAPSPLIQHAQRYLTGRPDPGKPKTESVDLKQIAMEDVSEEGPVEAAISAPVLKVLDQLTRPIHAIAGTADAAVQGTNLAQGFKHPGKTTFSDVLGHLGASGLVKSVGGFALDVGLDPTTYLTLGGSSAARQAATTAARSAYKTALRSASARLAAERAAQDALRRGATADAAKAAGKTAARRHARRAAQRAGERAARGKATNSGLRVAFAGRAVPGVTRATAAAKRAPRAAARRTRLESTRVGQKVDAGQQAVRNASRNFASDFNPAIAPAGVDRAAYAAARRSARTARAEAQRGTYRAGQRAIAFRNAIGPKNYDRVLDAIETGNVKSLPSHLKGPARELEQDFARMLKAERRAGLKVSTRANYVKHLRIKDPPRHGSPSVGSRTVRAGFQKTRTEGTIREKNLAEPGAYSTDIADLYVNRGAESAVARAKAKLNQAMVKAGRKPQQGVKLREQLRDNESLFVVEGSDLRKVAAKSNEARGVIDGTRKGRYVILNEKVLARTRGTVAAAAERSTAGVFFDRVTGVWKLAATQINPGYHTRNFVSEGFNAYLAENPIILGRNAVQAARALRQLGRNEDALRVLGGKAKGGKYSEFIREAEDVGAVRAGQIGRELRQMLGGESAKHGVTAPARRAIRRRVGRAMSNIEDVFRLATYKSGIDRGLTPEQAVERASRNHFDYGDLTPLERKVLRRVFPFYTFSARNIPLQIRTLLHQPGKFAQYQKLREEIAKAFGIDLDKAQQQSTEYEQRGAPIYVKFGGKVIPISMGPSGLPLTDLNEFPATGNPIKQADEWMQRAASLLHPAIKTPTELWANVSFFFRDQIERDTGPLAPAPSWVKAIPKEFRDKLGIVDDYRNTRTGQRQWGAPAKVVYALGVLPGPLNFANRLSTPSERQTTPQKVVGYLGLRAIPLDPTTAKIDSLYDDRDKVSKRLAGMRQRGISADKPTPTYTRLLAKENDITSHIFALRTKRGDKFKPGGSTKKPAFSDPAINGALDTLRTKAKSRFSDPEIEKALQKLRG